MIHRPRTLISRIPALSLAFLLTAYCLQPAALAQTATATLSGTVVDQNGAVVAGVAITVINPATSLERSATTSDSGSFTIPLLPPGTYTLTAKRDGFKIIRAENIVLNVNDERALQINLQVGDVNEVVDVTGETPLINESPAVGTVVDRQFVANLPLNGRSFQSLITLAPGVVLTSTSFGNQGQFSVNGQRTDANYFTVDGVSANIGISAGQGFGQLGGGALPGLGATGGTNNLVSVDAVQEFHVLTSTFAPEFGRTPGGQISIVTRAGTNVLHGALFDYIRNDALDAADWFRNALRQPKTPLRQNDFGGTLGGPIVKDHTHFFVSYEGLRVLQPKVATRDVPSLLARQVASPTMAPFLNAFPKPNGPDTLPGMAEFTTSYSDRLELDAFSIRVDHKVNDRLFLFGRYSHAPSKAVQRGSGSLSILSTTNINTKTFTSGLTHTINPRLTNELKFNYSQNEGGTIFELDDFGGAVVPPESVLFPYTTPAFLTFSVFAGRGVSLNPGVNADSQQRQINIVDNVSYLVGSHALKFGVDYRRLFPAFGPGPYVQFVGFNGVGQPGSPAVGTALSDRASFGRISARDPITLYFDNFAVFMQDSWRANNRTTLTYGLRWDLNLPPSGNKDLLTVTGIESPGSMTLAPLGTPLYKTSYNNFAPRIGVSIQVGRKAGWETVARGGFGIFFDLGYGSLGNTVLSFPYQRQRTLDPTGGIPFPFSTSNATPPPFDLSLPIPEIYVADPGLQTPRTYQWNLAIQQSIGKNQTASATYVGAAGRKLLQQQNLNNPNPRFGLVHITTNAATSDYHGLQLQFTRRLSRGLQGIASYTWSHSIDTDSADSSFNAPIGQFLDPKLSRGSSSFDVRHVLTGGVTYDLPTPRKHKAVRTIFGNWSLNSVFAARTGYPINIITGSFNLFGDSPRPNLTPGIPIFLNDPTAPGGRLINNTVDASRPGCKGPFCPPPAGQQGNLGRNSIEGFGMWQVDFSLRRTFAIRERIKLKLLAELFNAFNHPNFADPGVGSSNNRMNSPAFGRSASLLASGLGTGGANGGFNPLYQVGGPRSVQLSMKIEF